jgi:hypothetical protein
MHSQGKAPVSRCVIADFDFASRSLAEHDNIADVKAIGVRKANDSERANPIH